MSEYDRDQHKEDMLKWLGSTNHGFDMENDLHNAIYTMNELGLWPDDVEVSEAQVLACWKLVHKLQRVSHFPQELRM